MSDSLLTLIEGLISAQVHVIVAERVCEQIEPTNAEGLDLMLQQRTDSRQRFSQKVGAFLGVVHILAEERIAQYERRLD